MEAFLEGIGFAIGCLGFFGGIGIVIWSICNRV